MLEERTDITDTEEGQLGNQSDEEEKTNEEVKSEPTGEENLKELEEQSFLQSHGAPEKFKRMKDLLAWGSESEKNMSKLASEKGKLLEQVREMEEERETFQAKLDELEKKGQLEKETGLTKEQWDEINLQIEEEWATDKLGTFMKLIKIMKGSFQKEKKEEEEEATTQKQYKENDEYEKECEKKYGKEKWQEMISEIMKIQKETGILNLRHLVAIWKDLQEGKEEKNKAENSVKEAEKKKASTETGGGIGGLTEGLMQKIQSAKSLKELDQIMKK